MRFLDTHCHLDDILARLGVVSFTELRHRFFPPEFAGCVTISCDPDSVEPTLTLLAEDRVFGAFGIHPHEAERYTPEIAARIEAALRHPRCVAYGEIGLDYHYDHAPRALQQQVFIRQIEAGVAAGKPLIIHTREAEADTLAILRAHAPADWPMHVHCFTSSQDLAADLLADFSRLCIGFTGIVTFKNAEAVRDVVRNVPVERMLVETDGPYLAPNPYRGQVAHPGHIPLIIAKLAEIKGESTASLAEILCENARQLYKLPAEIATE